MLTDKQKQMTLSIHLSKSRRSNFILEDNCLYPRCHHGYTPGREDRLTSDGHNTLPGRSTVENGGVNRGYPAKMMPRDAERCHQDDPVGGGNNGGVEPPSGGTWRKEPWWAGG